MRKFKTLSIFAVLLIGTVFAIPGCVTNSDSGSHVKEITITDMEGRSVILKAPVERIVLMESSKTQELAAIEGEGIADKIVGWDIDFKQNAGDAYSKLVEKYPKMADIPDVGSLDDNTFGIEKVISLKPDVVIMHNWEYMWNRDATEDAVAKLNEAEIPVLFVDFYMDPMINSTKSMLLLGKVLGKEQRAQDIVDFYDDQVNIVYSRIAKINDKRPSVYIEVASKGPSTYGISYGDVAWGAIIKKARGENIAEPVLLNKSKALSPEYLVNQNPDIIVLTGRNWSGPGALRMGYTTTSDMAKSTMEPYVNRPGWDTINAVKDHKVYGIYHGYCFSIYNFAALQAFARWFYPEEFKDIDPSNTLKQYHEKFMPIDYSGTQVYSYY